MLFINEWYPNPAGKDDGEFIELYNNGPAMALNGYALGTGAKRTFKLAGYRIASGGYLLLPKTETKLSLKNTDGEVLLYGPDGAVMDRAEFAGPAPEGRSYSRVDYRPLPIGHFIFAYPTPGAANRKADLSVAERNYPIGVPLSPRLGLGSASALAFGAALTIVLIFIYVIRKNRNISDIFFPRDERARG